MYLPRDVSVSNDELTQKCFFGVYKANQHSKEYIICNLLYEKGTINFGEDGLYIVSHKISFYYGI